MNNFFENCLFVAMLQLNYSEFYLETGTDEAGRGCLSEPVVATAVILPQNFEHPLLNNSKQLTEKQSQKLRPFIEKNVLAYGISFIYQKEIDKINILQASIKGDAPIYKINRIIWDYT